MSIFEEFTELLETLIASGDKFIIAGDFNIHFEIATDSMTARLMEILSIFNLLQLVLGATHRHGHTLDLVITHLPDIDISNINITNILLGDHYLINFEVTLCIEITEYKTVRNRNVHQINKCQFSDELAIVINGINLDENFGTVLKEYNEKLEHLINTHAPVTKQNIKVVNHASWFDNKYWEMRKRRRKAEKTFKRTGLIRDKELFQALRAETTQLSRSKKMQYSKNKRSCQQTKNIVFRYKEASGYWSERKTPDCRQ